MDDEVGKMNMCRLVVHVEDVVPFISDGNQGICQSQAIIEPDGVGSTRLFVTQFTLLPHKENRGGTHPEGSDEVYYVLKGRGTVVLGGDAEGCGAEEYEVQPGTAVFIPGGTFHRVRNSTDEDFVMLTIWPHTPAPGANSAFDGRKKVWGTTFRTFRDGT